MTMAATIGHNSFRRLFTAPIVEVDPNESIAADVLQNDIAFDAWTKDVVDVHSDRAVPVVRASVYTYVGLRQEIESELRRYFKSDPRRPVVMRGALNMMIKKHSLSITSMSPNGYAMEVMRRYFRRFKTTDQRRNRRLIERGVMLISKKHDISDGFHNRVMAWEKCLFGRQPVYHPPSVQVESAPAPQPKPRIKTTKQDERVILRAVYELGLVSPSTTEKHNGTR